MRWNRMTNLLAGLNFRRVTAVDGKNLDGPEYNKPGRQIRIEDLSRYNRACILSHRRVCEEFLAGPDDYCCVLEDDVLLSPDFPRFVNRADWIPADCHLLKIETLRAEVCLSTKTIPCLNRVATRLRSPHLGMAGYVVSRRGAQKILDLTVIPDRAVDRLIFEEPGLSELPSYQMVPALCIQSCMNGRELIFPEMASTIQPPTPAPVVPPRMPVRHPVLNKIQREFSRPFRQLNRLLARTALRLQGMRRLRIPFA